ncbi:hypothetical protein LBMAG53_12770 [Planctomycetota bacterium]|nr:hypothetical protein LBMAG53_12770 [Planctomycetota bacterium]
MPRPSSESFEDIAASLRALGDGTFGKPATPPLPRSVSQFRNSDSFQPDEDQAPPSEMPVASRYKMGRLLGRGGQGRVFSCRHDFLDREVAIKLLERSDQVHRARFRTEARITASLAHPSVTTVYDAGEGLLVMELLSGVPFDQFIGTDPALIDVPMAVDVLIKVCQAVEYAHTRGVLHRDIKAANVVTGQFGEAILIDWGLAVRLDKGHLPRDQEGLPVPVCAGTPACLPPELFDNRHDRIGTASDVFLLGAMLYHVLAGRMPYDEGEELDDTLALARSGDCPPVERLNPAAPPRLVALARRAMAMAPADRLSAADLRAELQKWARQSGNIDAARHCIELGRLLVQRAQMCSRREQEVKTDCYLQALAQYDEAIALAPDMPGLSTERQWIMGEFIEALVGGGDISMARLLERHNRLPVLRPPSIADSRRPESVSALRRSGV